jgi:hypothetical protein
MSEESSQLSAFECDICSDPVYSKHDNQTPYGWCQYCEEFSICYKRDREHDMSLLYNEGCCKHHTGGFSVCIPCALNAFKEKVNGEFVPGKEHCLCPVCHHDFGLLSKLKESEESEEPEESMTCNVCTDPVCSEQGHADSYGSCQYCEEFSICYKKDTEHDRSLLYNEGCREHHSGGFSICIPCALKAFTIKNKDFEPGEEHCICPLCTYDFGLLRELLYKK